MVISKYLRKSYNNEKIMNRRHTYKTEVKIALFLVMKQKILHPHCGLIPPTGLVNRTFKHPLPSIF
jgi:hypothetical protein